MSGFLKRRKTARYDYSPSRSRFALFRRCVKDFLEKEKCELALLVTGADGNFDATSQKCLKYLLGSAGLRAMEPTIDTANSEGLERLEDSLVIAVRKDGTVHVFYHEASLCDSSVKDMIYSWPSSIVIETKVSAAKTQEDVENAKINFFVSEASRAPKGARIAIGASKDIEKWPLVQAFALTDVGDPDSGFFTQKYRAVEFEAAVNANLLSHVGAHNMAHILKSMENLSSHWHSMLRLLDRCSPEKRGRLKPEQIAEPVITFYEFGSIRFSAAQKEGRGAHARWTSVDKESGMNLLEIRGDDASTGLRLIRTYVFHSGDRRCGAAARGIKTLEDLSRVHQRVLLACTSALEGSAVPCVLDASKARAEKRLSEIAQNEFERLTRSSDAGSLSVHIQSVDSCGNACKPSESRRSVHFVCLALNCPESERPICIGDTIAISPQNYAPEIESSQFFGQGTVLTGDIPYFGQWKTEEVADAALWGNELLGDPVEKFSFSCFMNVYDSNAKCIRGVCGALLPAKATFHQRGISLSDENGNVVLCLSILDTIEVLHLAFQSSEVSLPSLIAFRSVPSATAMPGLLAPVFQSENDSVCLSFHSEYDIQRALLAARKIINENAASVAITTSQLQCSAASKSFLAVQAKSYRHNAWNSFLSSIEAEDCAGNDVHPGGVLHDGDQPGFELTLVSGIPGPKRTVAIALANALEAHVIQNEWAHGESFDARRVVKRLRKEEKSSDAVDRAVLILPGSISAREAFQALKTAFQKSRIGTRVSINSSIAVLPGSLLSVWSQQFCERGWVSSIVVTNCEQANPEELDDSLQRLRSRNPSATIIRVGDSLLDPDACTSLDSGALARLAKENAFHLRAALINSRKQALAKVSSATALQDHVIEIPQKVMSRVRLLRMLQRLTRKGDERPEEPIHAERDQVPQLGLRRMQQLASAKVQRRKDEKDRRDIDSIPIPEQQCVHVEGVCVFEDGEAHYVNASCGSVCVKKVRDFSKTSMLPLLEKIKQFAGSKKPQKLTFTFIQSPSRERVARIMGMCAPVAILKRTRSSLTDDEIRAIHDGSRKGYSLPPGFYFDGRNYLDHSGSILKYHPRIEEFIQDWLARENKRIDLLNARAGLLS